MSTPNRLLVSFSGGETSAMMTHWLLNNDLGYDEILVLFANTGQENEETLDFVRKCDREFGFTTTWVETDIDPENRRVARHKVVDFDSASRDGLPFEKVIQAYGLPNRSWPHCTRELKLRPMGSYLRSIGWGTGSYDSAVGIRVDEIDRISTKAKINRIIYPLVTHIPSTKVDVNTFWASQRFRLRLKGYEGNCKWCWKKTLRKHLTLITDHPQRYDFPREMERRYGQFNVDGHDEPRVFFREGRSTDDLAAMAKSETFVPYEDDSIIVHDAGLDTSDGCSESCEVDLTELSEIDR